jgi:GntR family transcriptional repressor for pyruvate dehydrogenase complex
MEQYNYEFHMLIARCSGNAYLVEALDRLASKIRMVRPLILPSIKDYTAQAEKVYLSHMKIYETILSGDAETAESLSRNHLLQSSDWAIQLLDQNIGH